MNVSAKLLQTVRDHLIANPPPGIKPIEISVIPEGRVPPSAGQRWLTVHGTTMTGLTPRKAIRKRAITFGISLTQRVRDIPNDRFGEIAYLEALSMTEALDEVIPLIESEDFFQVFKESLDEIKIPSSLVASDNTATIPPRYQLTDSFRFLTMNLDPQHLYPSDFHTRSGNDKEQLYDKIAGFRLTAVFESPEFQETYSPIQCKPLYDGT